MIRKATASDLDHVERCFVEFLEYEQKHGAYTSWKLHVYPTRQTAEKSLLEESLYVMEQDGEICACIMASPNQPPKFIDIEWRYPARPDEVTVINLLCVKPSKARRGIGRSLVQFVVEEAKNRNCRVVRLDTGAKNMPAQALYTSVGFELAGRSNDYLFYELKI